MVLGLLTQSKTANDLAISFDILLRKIVQQTLSLTNHHGKTSLGMEVLFVHLKVLGQRVDAVGQNRDLDLGRTRVIFAGSVLRNDLLFGFLVHHLLFHLSFLLAVPQYTAGEMTACEGCRPVSVYRGKVIHNLL